MIEVGILDLCISVLLGEVLLLFSSVDNPTDDRAIGSRWIGREDNCGRGLRVGRIQTSDLRSKTSLIEDQALTNRTAALIRGAMEEVEGENVEKEASPFLDPSI